MIENIESPLKSAMSRVPNYYPDISRRLSQVMNEIGVNESTVNMRRHTGLLGENILTLGNQLVDNDYKQFFFGSKTEGTTTLGLNPDTDMLGCFNEVNVIQDWSEWQRDKLNLLMIDDDGTSPGYCRLQLLRPDIPVAREYLPDQHYEYDSRGTVVMMNTFIHQNLKEGEVRHGPANCTPEINWDIVLAFPCKTWPHAADAWIDRYNAKQPHNIQLIRKSVQSGCLLVGTGHCLSPNERLEWRISTSMAERYVMNNMNITQIKCYVLLKIILKTFINPYFPNTISSYHCKTILMYLTEKSQNEFWQEENLLLCVDVCLKLLKNCIYTNNCPHFFIPRNNLMAGRLAIQTRQELVVAFEHIICYLDRVILSIKIDNIGELLRAKCSCLQARCDYMVSVQPQYQICGQLFFNLMIYVLVSVNQLQSTNALEVRNSILEHIFMIYRTGKKIEREAVLWIMPSLCTNIGCLLASQCIAQGQSISNEALTFFSFGIDSDVASGRLKLASALYCAGYLERTIFVLCDVEERYNKHDALPICVCRSTVLQSNVWKLRRLDIINIKNIFSVKDCFAFGVSFTQKEKHCVPQALQYEMFRCTEEEMTMRNKRRDDWMDLAVVDSLPFLYYLQYMTYGGLDRQRDKQRALDKLIGSIMSEPHMFHRETAINLLGQCMEQEHRFEDAFLCYRNSLKERPTHNVARWHIVNLCTKLANP